MTTLGATNSTTTFPATAADVGAEPSGAVATHAAASDPHPTYTTAAELAAYAQPLDGDLTAIAGLTSAADKLPYFTGSGTAAVADFTSTGRSLVDDANVGAMRATLGLGMSHRSGIYYCQVCSGVTNNQADTVGVLYAAPFFAPISAAYDRIMTVATATVTGGAVTLGIYNDNGGKPGTLLLDAGQVAAATSGDKTITINQTLSGLYWIAVAGQTTTAGAGPNLIHATGISTGLFTIGTSSGFSLSVVAGYSQTGITGSLPSPWGSTFTEVVRMPLVYLRAT